METGPRRSHVAQPPRRVQQQKRFVSSAAAFGGDANANTKGLLHAENEAFPGSRRSAFNDALESVLRESRYEKEAAPSESRRGRLDFLPSKRFK